MTPKKFSCFSVIVLSFVFLSLSASPAHAQWATSGNNIYNTNTGNVGIGTTLPAVKLDVNGSATFRPGGTGGTLSVTTPATETGLVFLNTNRADIRFDNNTLKLLVGNGTSIPSASQGLAINTNGDINVGQAPNPERGKFSIGGTTNGGTALRILTQIVATATNFQMFGETIAPTFNVGSYSSDGFVVGLRVLGPDFTKVGTGTIADAYAGWFSTPTIGIHNLALKVDGAMQSTGNSGTFTTQSLSATGSYEGTIKFPYPFETAPKVFLSVNGEGTGDISVSGVRVKKGSVTKDGFGIDYNVDQVNKAGTTTIDWFAL